MNNTVHISLDLETWGTRPGFDLRSIGACVFAGSLVHDGSLGTIRPFYVATDNPTPPALAHNMMIPNDMTSCFVDDVQYYWDGVSNYRKHPLKRDPETVQWWTEQSDEAQAAFADPIDLREALVRFGVWLRELADDIYVLNDPTYRVPDDVRLWSHGAAFDPGILAEAYHACGLPVPWHYRAPRDTRTAFDMAGIEDHSAWLNQHPGPLGIPHHALDDAICQARAVCAVYDRLLRCVVAPPVDNP